jgi:hypothetical protein
MRNKNQFLQEIARRIFINQSAKAGVILGVGTNISTIFAKGSPNEKVVVGVMGANNRVR